MVKFQVQKNFGLSFVSLCFVGFIAWSKNRIFVRKFFTVVVLNVLLAFKNPAESKFAFYNGCNFFRLNRFQLILYLLSGPLLSRLISEKNFCVACVF